eukprot:12402312-Karenia_brevis.AAC.1
MGENKREERESQEESTSSSSKDGMKKPEEDEMEVQEEEEAREVKPIKMPKGPTEDEYNTHILTHLPYRNWCTHCVRGKKKNLRPITLAGEMLVAWQCGLLGVRVGEASNPGPSDEEAASDESDVPVSPLKVARLAACGTPAATQIDSLSDMPCHMAGNALRPDDVAADDESMEPETP